MNKFGKLDISLSEITSMQDVNRELRARALTYESLAYCFLVFVVKRSAVVVGTTMSLTNPAHGLLYWYLISNVFVFGVERGYFEIEGLSNKDAGSGDGDESTMQTVKNTADRMIDLLKKEAVRIRIEVPDFDNFFFQSPLSHHELDDEEEEEVDPFADV